MSIIVDLLADRIREALADGETTLEEWTSALAQVASDSDDK